MILKGSFIALMICMTGLAQAEDEMPMLTAPVIETPAATQVTPIPVIAPAAATPVATPVTTPVTLTAGPADMALIPAGEFTMGINPPEANAIVEKAGGMAKEFDSATPAHRVNLPAFYIDKYEVTNAQYQKFLDATGHAAPAEWEEEGGYPDKKAKHPVTFVSINDAEAYCKWAGKRLPSEAEWEKAARGTDGRFFPWGNTKWTASKALTQDSNKDGTAEVGSYKDGVSPYGVYDMAGNVWEWTSSKYEAYPECQVENGFFGDERYVLRGGSWDDLPYFSTTVIRSKYTPSTADELTGFRCAKDAK